MISREDNKAISLMLVGLIVGIAASFCSNLALGSFFFNRTEIPVIVPIVGWVGTLALFIWIYYLFIKSFKAIGESKDKRSNLTEKDWEKIANMIKNK